MRRWWRLFYTWVSEKARCGGWQTEEALEALVKVREDNVAPAHCLEVLERVCDLARQGRHDYPAIAATLPARTARLLENCGEVASIPVLSERARQALRLRLTHASSEQDLDLLLKEIVSAFITALSAHRFARREAMFQYP